MAGNPHQQQSNSRLEFLCVRWETMGDALGGWRWRRFLFRSIQQPNRVHPCHTQTTICGLLLLGIWGSQVMWWTYIRLLRFHHPFTKMIVTCVRRFKIIACMLRRRLCFFYWFQHKNCFGSCSLASVIRAHF